MHHSCQRYALRYETHAATLVATEAYSTGSCMLEAVALSEDGLQMRSGVTLRPLLKALIVPQARHQGIGTSRVDGVAALAANWGYKELLCYVNHTNEAARALYRRFGFAPVRDAPAENFVSWLSGGQMLIFPRKLQAGPPHQSAATRPRRRLGLATMRLPVAVSEALPWDESAYAAVEVEALWEAVLKAYGSEDAAVKAVRQVRSPSFLLPGHRCEDSLGHGVKTAWAVRSREARRGKGLLLDDSGCSLMSGARSDLTIGDFTSRSHLTTSRLHLVTSRSHLNPRDCTWSPRDRISSFAGAWPDRVPDLRDACAGGRISRRPGRAPGGRGGEDDHGQAPVRAHVWGRPVDGGS